MIGELLKILKDINDLQFIEVNYFYKYIASSGYDEYIVEETDVDYEEILSLIKENLLILYKTTHIYLDSSHDSCRYFKVYVPNYRGYVKYIEFEKCKKCGLDIDLDVSNNIFAKKMTCSEYMMQSALE